jgi:hypothetical protein
MTVSPGSMFPLDPGFIEQTLLGEQTNGFSGCFLPQRIAPMRKFLQSIS